MQVKNKHIVIIVKNIFIFLQSGKNDNKSADIQGVLQEKYHKKAILL